MTNFMAFILCYLLCNYNCLSFRNQSKQYEQNKGGVIITVKTDDVAVVNEFKLNIYENYLDENIPTRSVIAERKKDGIYLFKINNSKGPFYISLYKSTPLRHELQKILSLYLVEPGDNISISIVKEKGYRNTRSYNWYYSQSQQNDIYLKYKILFKGIGYEKYHCRYDVDKFTFFDTLTCRLINEKGEYNLLNHIDVSFNYSKKKINQLKRHVREETINILSADFFSRFELERINLIYAYQGFYRKANIWLGQDSIFSKLYNDITHEESKLSYDARIYSANFIDYLIERAIKIDQLLESGGNNFLDDNISSIYFQLKSKYQGALRDRILTSYMLKLEKLKRINNEILEDALKSVNSKICQQELANIATLYLKGRRVYNFSLLDLNGNKVELDKFRGKFVFIDFWFTGCGSCSYYYKNILSKIEAEFKNNPEIVFIAINVDQDKGLWIKSVESGNYTSKEVINLFTEGKGIDHPVINHYRISGYPHPILLDRNGRIYNNNFEELKKSGIDKLREAIISALKDDKFKNAF